MELLARDWPELRSTYERLYDRGAYVPRKVVGSLKASVADLGRRHGIADRRTLRVEPPADLPIGAFVQAPRQLTLMPPSVG
ncbi:hypothetical protein BH23CHL8_BH23CHL8_06290 [soil metagenome]